MTKSRQHHYHHFCDVNIVNQSVLLRNAPTPTIGTTTLEWFGMSGQRVDSNKRKRLYKPFCRDVESFVNRAYWINAFRAKDLFGYDRGSVLIFSEQLLFCNTS